MCAIAGLVSPRGAAVEGVALRAMAARLRHRGPDGEGLWIAPAGHVGFSHRRLSIIDLSPGAAQPMLDVEGRVCVTFNGEIYNHRELRRELEQLGRPFRTDHADTEVLLQGYLTWGLAGLLDRLNGIFAFALHDIASSETFLVRDPIGVKPLYFTWRRDELAFASEIKALARAPAPINSAAAYHYLTFMAAPAPMTLFDDVFKLPAGWLMRIGPDGAAAAQRYFAPWPDGALDAAAPQERAARLRDTLRRAVERQLVADVPVGLFLSGGVDSTSLLALATEISGQQLRTFSVGFSPRSELDETANAAEIARRFGARHTEVRIGPQDAAAALDALILEQDEPLADWVCLPLRALARAAHEAGLKTVLCGEGADEQFCGYEHYLRYLDIAAGPHKWASALHALGVGAPIAALAGAVAGRDLRCAFRADFLRRAALGQEAFWGGAIVFTDGMKRSVWSGPTPAARDDARLAAAGLAMPGSESSDVVRAVLAPLDARVPNADALQRMVWLELAQRLPELLLMRVDKMCMASALEARVPFLDIEMVRLSSQFGQASKIPGNRPKQLLKESLLGIVPDDVLNQPKKGFGAPVRDWLYGPFGALVRQRLADSRVYASLPIDRARVLALVDAHRARRGDYSVYVWTLFNLAAWHDRWACAHSA